MKTAPYGSWPSPIDPKSVASQSTRLSELSFSGGNLYWLERRPHEGGRTVVVERSPAGALQDVVPPNYNARSRVHEYGGGAYRVNVHDQRRTLFLVDDGMRGVFARQLSPDQEELPRRLDRENLEPGEPSRAYGDLEPDPTRHRVLAVCEATARGEAAQGTEPQASLVALEMGLPVAPITLQTGADFYSSPRVSPDGTKLCFLTWSHPDMPWDASQLFVARFNSQGRLETPTRVAGGPGHSIAHPFWAPDGSLIYASDQTGFWNLYRHQQGSASDTALWEKPAEFALPHWVFRMSTAAASKRGFLAAAFCEQGLWRLGVIDLKTGQTRELDLPYTAIDSVDAQGDQIACLVACPEAGTRIALIELEEDRSMRKLTEIDPLGNVPKHGQTVAHLSRGEAIEFATTDGQKAHAFYYPPAHDEVAGPSGTEAERPPLIVKSHGGPTAASTLEYQIAIQFWTSRGFGVADVNYRGSTGYGRVYRDQLGGHWGIRDVEDCLAAARHLVDRGLADEERLAIRGGSAGGYTTLCALTFHDLFSAGASLYGVGDLETLARDTHKFESRYLDGLIGPYPQRKDLYRERSPIHHIDQLLCPMILFQGLEDRVVPPNQAEAMVEALDKKGLPVAYVTFPEEQHGFRKAENIARTLEAELYFYSQIFGFELAEPVEPVEIKNQTARPLYSPQNSSGDTKPMSAIQAAVKSIFDQMPSKLNANAAAGMDAVIQYDLTGDGEGQYHCAIKDGACTVVEGPSDAPAMTVTIDAADFVDLIEGNLDGTSAFMSGKLKIAGDMGLAMKLGSLFSA